MSLGDHLEELRRRLIHSLLGVGVMVVAMLFVSKWLIGVICQPLLYQMAARGLAPRFELPTMTAGFAIYMKVAILGAVVLSLPWLLFQGWRFISPGLYKHEQKFVVALLPGSALLSILGVAFMYFVMLPATAWFMVDFAADFGTPGLSPTMVQEQFSRADPVEPLPATDGNRSQLIMPRLADDPNAPADGLVWINAGERALKTAVAGQVFVIAYLADPSLFEPGYHINEYISFVAWMGLAFSISFQLPLVMLLLGWTRITTAAAMARVRKYVVLGCFVFAMVLTPPDPISQVALAVPMYILYEFGLLLVRLTVGRGTEPADAEA